MEAHTKRFGVISGFTLMFLLLVLNAVTTRRQLSLQIDDQRWATHSRRVLLELAKTQVLIREAESGQRGYLYTGDRKYLAPYQNSISNIQPEIDKLTRLISDHPSQQANLANLRTLVAQKTAELARTISLFQSGKADQARALVLSDSGFRLMEGINKTIGDMNSAELSLEDARIDAYHRSTQKTILAIYLSSGIAALGLLFLAYYILREMKLRQKHARQLLEREEWFRVTLTSLGDAVIATDNAGNVTYLNPLAEQLIGIPAQQARGRSIEEAFPIFNEITLAPVENPISKVMELGHIVGLANHTVLRNASGSMIPIEDSAAPIRDRHDKLIGVVLVFRDATKERKIQDLLRESEKLSAASRIAATVAHEINNPLESVANLIYLAKINDGATEAIVEYLEVAEQELDRVSHIAKRTLGFYRELRKPESLDLHTVVEYVINLLDNKLQSRNVTVLREFDTCPPVVAISGELKQAISNLLSNAADAVSENGKIWVRLSCIPSNDNQIVQIQIEDDGPGIAPEHAKHVFEPFYTTKDDVGTGLGLWVTRGIVERHGGTIDLHPQNDIPRRGAIFTISLPIAGIDTQKAL
jgi:PAS domain S-box-containing protein